MALMLATVGHAQNVTRVAQAEAEWGFQRLVWNNSSNRTEYRYAVFNNGGTLEICGVYASRGANITRFGRQAMKEAILIVNGKRIWNDMRFFHQASNRAMQTKLVGARANCVNTFEPFPLGASQFSIEVPVSRFRLN
jgi:hypothetical protein